MTLKGHGDEIKSISYFPDGQKMISGSCDCTAQRWDLKEGKEIEEVWDVYKEEVRAVAVSRNSRWVVTGGAELKVFEVKTGTVKELQGHPRRIDCIDISVDNTSGSWDNTAATARIWNLETSKLVAGPLERWCLGSLAVREVTDVLPTTISGHLSHFKKISYPGVTFDFSARS
jgi:WD40 repeat protein